LINGYADYGPGEDALVSLELMQREGEAPDACTFTHCLKACSNIASISDGRCIHSQIVARGFESDPFLGNALIDMYGNCCLVGEARDVFGKLAACDTVSWNAMITAYAENGLGKEALDCYNLMRSNGCAPNGATFVAKLKACGAMGAIEKGREAHAEAVREGYYYATDPCNRSASIEHAHVSTALIDMYGKCGSIADARDVFDEMPASRHLVAWNALLSAYTSRGMSEAVLELFERMRGEGLQPDDVTFLAVLTACCRTGSLRKGKECFEAMSRARAIRPSIKHYNCIVDLLCRAGRIGEAVSMIEGMPVQPDQVTWNIVLGSCQSWGDVEIGREAFARSTMMMHSPESGSHSAFVLMSNLCTTS
jgi:pentatricopeptide repeat protein